MSVRYVHTNIVAKDWKALSNFYIRVFDCTPLEPKRDIHGPWVDNLTGIAGCRIRGIHLALPGYIDGGPTLEIFAYEPENKKESVKELNRYGLAHIAFHVENVEETVKALIENGGKQQGEIVQKIYPELGMLTAVYASDPEGNFIEIQNWDTGYVK